MHYRNLTRHVKRVIHRSMASTPTYLSREQHTSKSLHNDMKELFWKGGFSCEYQARPILMRIYAAIFCFSITQPEMPYILFKGGKSPTPSPLSITPKTSSIFEPGSA